MFNIFNKGKVKEEDLIPIVEPIEIGENQDRYYSIMKGIEEIQEGIIYLSKHIQELQNDIIRKK